jgi:tight adherence protein B
VSLELLFSVGTVVLCGAGAVGLRTSPTRRLRQRLRQVTAGAAVDPPRPERAAARRGRRRMTGAASALAVELEQAGVPLQPQEAYLIGAAAAVVLGAILWLTLGAVLAVVAAIGSIVAVRPLIRALGKMREARLEDQLADALDLMVGALRAGHGLVQALATAARQTPAPLGDLLSELGRELELGIPIEEALDHLATRSGVPDVHLLSAAVLVQRQIGGNLAEVLDHLSQTIRERLQFRRKLRAMTAQNRFSLWILSALPPGVGLLMGLMNPSLMSNVVGTTLGHIMLAIVLILDVCGMLVIRSMIRLEV